MRLFITVLMLALLLGLVGCNSQEASQRTGNTAQPNQSAQPAQQPAHNPGEARRITAEELHQLYVKNEVLIVDTRTEPAFRQSHIKGAILIPHAEFPARADELSKSKMIVAYCSCPAEQTSGAAVLTLKAKGFDNAAALTGGLDAWARAGYPTESAQ